MRISDVTIGEHSFEVELDDGQTLGVPFRLYPRLHNGTPEERDHWHLIGNGKGIRWDDLDEDISLENILSGERSHESTKSLRKWLRSRNQLTINA